MGMAGTVQAADAPDPIKLDNTTETVPTWLDPNVFSAVLADLRPAFLLTSVTNNKITSTYKTGDAAGGSIYFQGGMVTPVAQLELTTTDGVQITGNSLSGTRTIEGGALALKGVNATFTNAVIQNNNVTSTSTTGAAMGGAIDAVYKGNTLHAYMQLEDGTWDYKDIPVSLSTQVTFDVTKDLAYTGNTVTTSGSASTLYDFESTGTGTPFGSTGGGFMVLEPGSDATFNIAAGATLTLGTSTVTGDTDAISSLISYSSSEAMYNPYITKTGEGTLTINSTLDKYYGDFNINAGTVNLNKNLNLANTYTVSGGTLNLKDVTIDKLYDKLAATGLTGYTADAENETLQGTVIGTTELGTAHKVANTAGSLVTKADTTVNAGAVTVTDGGSIDAAGRLNLASLSVDNGKVTASDATISSGTLSAADNATVSIGGSDLSLNKITVDSTSNVTLTGGTLNATTLTDAITGGGKITLDGTAVLSTTADQVFTNTATTETTDSDTSALTSTASNLVNFTAGKIALNDTKYTLTYLQDVKDVMTANKSNTGIIMKGTLVDESGDTVSSLSVDTISNLGSGVELDTVSATTDKDLNISSTGVSGLSAASLEMTGDANTVTVSDQTLTLGGAETTDVITTKNGTASVSLTNDSTLNIGNDSVAADHALTVDANLAATDSAINTNGVTTVNGTVALADSSLDAKTGTLTLSQDLTTSGTSKVAGDVTIDGSITNSGDTASSLQVGNSAEKSTLTTNNIDLNGGTLDVASGSSLTLGTKDNTANALTVDATVKAADSTITTNKATTVTGDVSLTNSTLAATAGTLSVEKNLTASGTNSVTGDVAVAGDINSAGTGNLNLGDDTTAATVTASNVDLNGGTLTMAKDSSLTTTGTNSTIDAAITADNATVTTNGNATITGNVSLADSSLNTNNGTVTLAQDLTTTGSSVISGNVNINGSLTVGGDYNTNSVLAVNGDTTVDGDLSLAGTIRYKRTATLNVADSLTVSGDVSIDRTTTITGAVDVGGDIQGKSFKAVLNVGDSDSAGEISANSIDMHQGTLFLDPVWVNGDEMADGTEVATNSISRARVIVGSNSTFTLGSEDKTLAENAFKDSGLTWGTDGVLSAVYAAASTSLANYSSVDYSTRQYTLSNTLYVDSNAESTVIPKNYGSLTMGDNTLLMVKGSAVSGSQAAAFTDVVSTDISQSAKLYIDGAVKNTTYNILSASKETTFTNLGLTVAAGNVKEGNAWYVDAGEDASSNILVHNQLLKVVGAEGNSETQFSVTTELRDASEVYGNTNNINLVNAALVSTTPAADFFMTASDDTINSTKADQMNAMQSATSLTELAGVQHGLYTAGNLFTGAVANHLADVKDTTLDKDLWAHYIHDKENIRGLAVDGLSGADYDAQYNGVVVGSDLYHNNGVVAGAALTYMDGSFSGSSDTASTKNDADYYGLSLYGRVRRGQTSYLGDISWLHGKNDLSQYNSGSEITGDVSSNAYTAGVRAEHDFAAGDGTLTPYAGVRYAHLDYGNYTDSLGIHHDSDNANLWLIPVGLRYTQDFSMDGWNVKPIAEAGYLWTLGDRNSDERLNINGSASTFGYDVSDSGSFYGRLGIEAEHGPMTYGLGYQYQKGSDVRSNVWSLALRYKF